jgi:radical SAM superfamily enzyme YgiQ (UPF0313 family)
VEYRRFYERFHSDLTGLGLWLRGDEPNRMPLPDGLADGLKGPSGPSFRILFSRLSTYADTAGSFTHPMLYAIAAGIQGVYADWAFLPPAPDAAIMNAHKIPWLIGTQSKLGPRAFDVIGLSNSIAQELVNIPGMLKRSGIPLSKKERLADADLPLLLLGGANAAFLGLLQGAGEQYTPVDGIFTGEDPSLIEQLITQCRDGKAAGKSKLELLEDLERLPGFYQPDRPKPTRKTFWDAAALVPRLPRMPMPFSESRLGHWPLSEGCPAFCSFCAESWARKPYRETKSDLFSRFAAEYKKSSGLEGIELFSFNFNMHSELFGILGKALEVFNTVSLKSQRFDWLAHTPELPQILKALGKGSITCGLEGISPRLRRFLQKSLDETSLWGGLEAIAAAGMRELKIFLIATGREEDADYLAYASFLDRLHAVLSRGRTPPRVILSVTPLVRFPWTPLEFEPAPAPAVLEKILRRIERLSARHNFEVRNAADASEYLLSQILLKADSPAILEALLEAIEQTGFIYYRDVPRHAVDALVDCLSRRGVELSKLLGGFNLEESGQKPWAIHETGVRREFLWDQYRKAVAFVDDAYCLGHHRRNGICLACGACPDAATRKGITHARQEKTAPVPSFLETLKKRRANIFTQHFHVRLAGRARGIPRWMVGGQLARAFMQAEPALVPWFRQCTGSLASPDLGPCYAVGDDVLTLSWLLPAKEILAKHSQKTFIDRLNLEWAPWGQLITPLDALPPVQRYVFISPFKPNADLWLKENNLKHTLRRAGPKKLEFQFTPDALKKKILDRLEIMEDKRGEKIFWKVLLRPGPKFSQESFVQKAFQLPSKNAWVNIRTGIVLQSHRQ